MPRRAADQPVTRHRSMRLWPISSSSPSACLYWGRDAARRYPRLILGYFLLGVFGFRLFVESIKNVQGVLGDRYRQHYGLNMGQIPQHPFILAGMVHDHLRLPPSVRPRARHHTNERISPPSTGVERVLPPSVRLEQLYLYNIYTRYVPSPSGL